MPIYEYQCTSCHHQFEIMQKINDAPVHQCPKCFQNNAERLLSASGFQLKGTGWYATDFKNKGQGPKPVSSESSASDDSAKTSTDKSSSTTSSTTKGDNS